MADLVRKAELCLRPWVGCPTVFCFSRMRSKGSRFTLGGLGVEGVFARRCVHGRNRSQPFATVRNRPQPSARSPYGRAYGKFCRGCPFLEVSDVSLLRFAWQAWHFVTFRRVLERVESRFAWQAQYFCDVFRRCVAVFVAGAALWTFHRHFSWQAQHFRRVVLRVFCKSHWQGCVKWRQGANSVAVVAFCAMC